MAIESSLAGALKKLNKLILLDKRDLGTIYFFAIVAGVISLIMPLGIQSIINFVMAAELSTSVVVLITFVIAAVILSGIIQLKQMQVIERIRQKIFSRYSLEFSDTIPKIQLERVDDYYLPELTNRFFDTINLSKGIEKILLDIPTAIMQILVGLILISFYHPVFIAFGALLVVILILIMRVTSAEGFRTSMEASEKKYEIVGWFQELARGINTFRYSKGTELHMRKTDQILTSYLKQRTAHFKILETQFKSLVSFKVLIISAMLIVGTILLLNQQINIGQFIAADIVILLIVSSIEKLIANMDNVFSCLTALEKLGKIVDRDVEVGGQLMYKVENGCKISFGNVSYTYPDGSMALNNVDIQIDNEEITVIQGASGAGKSSTLKLLSGGYENFEGSININDIPIGNYDLNSLRKATGILLQQQDIFEGTVLDNITMGHEGIPMNEIVALSKLVGLDVFIGAGKKGFDTMIDPTGKRLSRIVKQQLLLMRALAGRHSLLLLENPFKHLEQSVASAVLDFIKNQKITTIIVAESIEWAQAADQIILLEDGVATKIK